MPIGSGPLAVPMPPAPTWPDSVSHPGGFNAAGRNAPTTEEEARALVRGQVELGVHALHRPAQVDGQRASTLRFGAPRVQELLAALLRFEPLPAGFRNRELRETVAPLRGMSLEDYNAGQMTYDLRRLRL